MMKRGGARGLVRDLLKSVVAVVQDVFKWAEELWERMLGGEKKARDPLEADSSGFVAKVASFFSMIASSWALSILAGTLLVVLLALIVKIIIDRVRKLEPQTVEAEVLGVIDLESEEVVATQLPEDEWLRMAKEKIGQGEYRLAVRALFLATLAHLGERGLLKVVKSKSNRDYSGELSLKARSMPVVIEAFGENVGLFEWVWYGLHDIGDDAVARFTKNYEQITRVTAQTEEDKHAS